MLGGSKGQRLGKEDWSPKKGIEKSRIVSKRLSSVSKEGHLSWAAVKGDDKPRGTVTIPQNASVASIPQSHKSSPVLSSR